jgi:hypothetical protein
MSYAVVYKNTDGSIVGQRSYDTDHPANGAAIPSGCSELFTDSITHWNTHYITGTPPTVTARPTPACTLDKSTITANGTDTATLSGIPTGASVRVTDSNGATDYTVNDGTLEITADEPGTITITVTPAFPYKPLTVTVTAS